VCLGLALRQERDQQPSVRTWIAVLVLTDNCTRQCLGLPLFVAGARITAAEVTTALRALLPPALQFLISDRGIHFTAHDLADLTADRDFVHVLIARHRPESNGIAERFVQTVKTWLRTHPWASADELATLLVRFQDEYNARPHQGISIPVRRAIHRSCHSRSSCRRSARRALCAARTTIC